MSIKIFLVFSLLVALSSLQAQSPDDIVEAQLSQMSLEQKVGQMFMASFYGAPMNQPARQLIADLQPGAVVLLPSNLGTPEQITALTNSIQSELMGQGAPPALIAVDQEGGRIARLKEGFTEFPVPMLWTAANHDYAYRIGRAIATEMSAVGIHMNLAPVADVNTNPRNPIIGRRAFGDDAQQIAPIIADFVRGLQDGGVLATAKHFPGHGDTATDSHIELPTIPHDRQRLQTVEWLPFRAVQDADVAAIMTAHLVLPALDPDLPASLSPATIAILRDEWQYEGIIITDALDMNAISATYNPADAALAAVRAGNDMILLGAHVNPDNFRRAHQAIVDAVRADEIPLARIDASVRRILHAKARYDLLQWQPLDPLTASQRIPLEAHAQLIAELFRAGIATVRDTDSHLPLQGDVLFLYPDTRFTLWRTCAEVAQQHGQRLRALGMPLSPAPDAIADAVQSARTADTVVAFTLDAIYDANQVRYINALPPDRTVLVALQSPHDAALFPQLSTIVLTYSALFVGQDALCQALLTGDVRGQVVNNTRYP